MHCHARWIFWAAGILLSLSCMPRPAHAQDWVIGSAQAEPDPQARPYAERAFSIPGGTLQSALELFSAQSGIQTLYQAPIAAGHMAHPVSGTLDPVAALRILLQGTGLTPVEVFHGGYTLVPTQLAGSGAPISAMVSPIIAPTLTLKTLHVQAPSEEERRLYAKTVQYAILGALSRDRAVRRAAFTADLFVWVSPTGLVEDAALYTSTGNTRTDLAIANIVRSVVVGRSPPADLPQPVHVRILTETASR